MRFEQNGKEWRAELSGRVTIDSSPEFRASLLRVLRAPECQRLEVNFSEVVYIDTSGVAVSWWKVPELAARHPAARNSN